MSKSTSRLVNMKLIADKGPLGVILIRLMMTLSDLVLTSDALGQWNAEERRERRGVKRSARAYFVRLQMAHLYEGLRVIEDIETDHMDRIEACDPQTRASFEKCRAFVKDKTKYESIVGLVRNTLTFHYGHNTRLIGLALKEIALEHPEKDVWITRGRDLHHWLYEPAQLVVDKVMVRKALRLEGPVTGGDADEVLAPVFAVRDAFSDFAAQFIERYAR